jgi:hypothetical protein
MTRKLRLRKAERKGGKNGKVMKVKKKKKWQCRL